MLSFPANSYSKVYRWVDKKGNIHFTDDPSEIPPASEIELEELIVPRSSPQKSSPDSKKGKENAVSKKIQDKSQKENWQSKLADIQKELEENKANAEALEAELKRPKYKRLVRREKLRRKELEAVKKEIDRLEKEQAEIEEKLKTTQ